MANFGWQTLKNQSASGNSFAFQSLFHYDNVTRVNNTVTVHGANTVFRLVRTAGNWTTYNNGSQTDVRTEVPRGTLRQSTRVLNPGDFVNVGQEYWGVAQSPSVSVGPDQTSFEINHGFYNQGDYWAGGHFISFGALGAPAGVTYFNSRTDTSLNVRNDVTDWGAYATAGSVRSYRADNASFAGEVYIDTSDNANVNHTGLLPNKQYWFRGWAYNGGGKSSYMNAISAVTLANATETSKNVQAATAKFTLAVSQGVRATTAKVQYRKQGDTGWTDSPNGTGATPVISISGLLPSSDYEYRLAVTTSDGTWTGATQTLTTLPAAKLVMPDGSVKNAIPRAVMPDGSVIMVKVNIVQ